MSHDTCKICKDDKPYSRLDVHVRKFHNMDMDEYSIYDPDLLEVMEFEPSEPISHVTRMDNIFSGKVKESYVDRPLKDFLSKYNIAEKELTAIIKNYTEGKPLPLEQAHKLGEKRGIEEAKTLKHLKSVKTPNLQTAEALEKHYGFKCTAVHSAKDSTPKRWELEKQTET